MARKKVVEDENIRTIKKILETGNMVIGTKETIKNMRLGRLATVYVTSNCPVGVNNDLAHYKSISGTEVIQLEQPNDELGIICKKPFAISVLGVLKGGN
ncbi:ribosomal L7Ae/L30e/S12e/Gadd45 family protein [Candidatus Woesearchaeota archaeon]|nr:ribosomal L7Ae/L30e/S12e/Gadd45 family protein [Candidatus Woesearchaeota archaeon]